jgi:hypothetical protein
MHNFDHTSRLSFFNCHHATSLKSLSVKICLNLLFNWCIRTANENQFDVARLTIGCKEELYVQQMLHDKQADVIKHIQIVCISTKCFLFDYYFDINHVESILIDVYLSELLLPFVV